MGNSRGNTAKYATTSKYSEHQAKKRVFCDFCDMGIRHCLPKYVVVVTSQSRPAWGALCYASVEIGTFVRAVTGLK